MTYKAKVDRWMIVFLSIAPFSCVGATKLIFQYPVSEFVVDLVIAYIIASLYFLILMTTKYILGDNELIICTAWVKQKIEYKRIHSIHLARGKCSMQAPSCTQLQLIGKDSVRRSIAPSEIEACEKELNRKIESNK